MSARGRTAGRGAAAAVGSGAVRALGAQAVLSPGSRRRGSKLQLLLVAAAAELLCAGATVQKKCGCAEREKGEGVRATCGVAAAHGCY